ncbi:hypothetical protein I6H42_08060 [Schaalia meyeri]|uniref:Excreted virulence factor EspC, type VII ESX diderm n=1 Tax=Schaalia meyeri TaxID=52773 RepID=A0AAP9Y890_9ACTO|nr:hypothetical protein [Schaalia meyeri]OFQ23682.1 hypothetical protein HMPREF2946_08805 [Actinomyces sp. HMSC062G12]QQC43715.1 hypothetical protein I6H42_08060 [Schaalia meyeri]SDS15171.1 hypothetical protein SAMN04489715_1714 [Schaalia meyeri]
MNGVGFDSQKHEQTRYDAEQGGAHLGSAARVAETFAQAQVSSVWGDEPGVDAARRALQAAYSGAANGFSSEQARITDFGDRVEQTEKDFAQTEENIVQQMASNSAAMNADSSISNAASQPTDAPTAGNPSGF